MAGLAEGISVTADAPTNSLIIQATKEGYSTISGVIAMLDIPRAQVLVEALIMEVDVTDSKDLGFNGVMKLIHGGTEIVVAGATDAVTAGLLGVPAFIFHEGGEITAGRAFTQHAQLTGGAYCRFDANSAQQLRDLLSAVAVYAAGGHKALQDFGKRRGGAVLQLTHQVRKG